MSNQPEQDNADDERIVAELLQIGGERAAMPAALKERLASGFAEDLKVQQLTREQQGKRKRQWMMAVPMCASALIAAVLFMKPSTPAVSLVPHTIVANMTGKVQVISGDETRALTAGDTLYTDDLLKTGREALLVFQLGDHQVRLNANSSLKLGTADLWLETGDVYIDSGAGEKQGIKLSSVTVTTPHGSVTDIGTQFMVSSDQSGTEAFVRQGTINVNGKSRTISVSATDDSAMRVEIGSDGLQSSSAPRFGPEWQWLEQLPGKFRLDARSVHQYLQWVESETGLVAHYASDAVELKSNSTMLKGELDGMTPAVGTIAMVLSTTRLQSTQDSDGKLLISIRK